MKASQAATVVTEDVAPDVPAATAALRTGLTIDLSQLQDIFTQMYSSTYVTATHDAAEAVTAAGGDGQVLASLSDVVGDINWSAWAPGDGAGAAQVADGGLASLLNNANIELTSISNDRINELGNALAKGIAAGDSTTTISANLVTVLDNPSRANMVARTEVARAVTAASLETYRSNDVTQVELITADPCPICEEIEDENPWDIDDFPPPPEHVSCRCSTGPVISTDDTSAGPTDATSDADDAAVDEPTDDDLSEDAADTDLTQAVTPDTTKDVGPDAGILIVARDTGRVLLEQRSAENGGNWCIPAGTLEPGEAPLEGAVREFREELGLEPVGTLSGESVTSDGTTVFTFVVEQESDVDLSRVDPTALEGDVAAAVAWWAVSDAVAMGVPIPPEAW